MGTLSIVATPIGNLEDITLRALRVLKEADVVYAEDTRVTSKLLSAHGISVPLQRLDENVETLKAEEVIARLEAGEKVAFVSDAGTPGISDPGSRLVAAVRAALPEIKVEAIPGPSALTAALSIAGVDATEFVFKGFLPHKKGRQTALKAIAAEERVVILYESPHRIVRLLRELHEHIGERQVTLVREITKMFEEHLSGTPEALALKIEGTHSEKGEFVVIIHEITR